MCKYRFSVEVTFTKCRFTLPFARNRRDRRQSTQKTRRHIRSYERVELVCWTTRTRHYYQPGRNPSKGDAERDEQPVQPQQDLPPKKNHSHGTKRYDLHKRAQATLGNGDMRNAVAVPEGKDPNEWLAVHTVDFFNEISIIYGTIIEFCTAVLSADERRTKDNLKYKTPVKLAAPEYIDMLMACDLLPRLRRDRENIFRRLFRVYAHVYYSHFDEIVSLGAEAHLNSCFKHFMAFVTEFDLVDKREQEPLKDLIKNLIG